MSNAILAKAVDVPFRVALQVKTCLPFGNAAVLTVARKPAGTGFPRRVVPILPPE
jgi:hypothetical protein